MSVSFRHTTPPWYVRGAAYTPRVEAFLDGVQTAPTGTFTLLDETGSAVVNGQAIVLDGKTATYPVGAGTLASTLNLSWTWLEKWDLTVSGVAYTLRRQAALVKGSVYPGITVDDLLPRFPLVRRVLDAAIDPTGDDVIQDAWRYMIRQLQKQARRPPQVLNGDALIDWHIWLTLWLVCMGGGSSYADDAATFYQLASNEQKSLMLTLDFDSDGQPSSDEEGFGTQPQIFLTSRRVSPTWRVA